MSSAEQAVRARALALLSNDEELAGLVHGIFDGIPPRVSAPYVSVGAADGADWGTKDRAGREVRLTLALIGAESAADDRAVKRVEMAVAGLRGVAGDWSVVGARAVRTRFTSRREGGWRHEIVVRCRCLEG